MRYFFVLIITLFLSSTLNAQVNVSFNLGIQPIWGPIGYDYVEYYYLPDIDVYYYVPQHRFYYFDRGHWTYSSYLPSRYGNYNLYNSYKVVVNEWEPWRNNNIYRDKYISYIGNHDQLSIRDSRDPKYFVIKSHPQHNNWVKEQEHDNGNHNGWDKDNDDNEKDKQDNDNDKK